MSSSLPESTHIGRVALRVDELASVLSFYRDAVGLAVRERTDERAVLGAGDEALLVLQETDAPRRSVDETGLYHTAFRVPDRAALGDALARLPELDGASDHLVSEALYASDPEGNGVEIYRDRPRAEWPDAPDGEVRMDTLPLDTDALRADAGGADAAPSETTVGHVHLEVSSLAGSRPFYADALGLDVKQELHGACFLAAGEYHHHVGLNVWRRRSAPPTGRGLDWFELRAPEDALDAARERIADAGYEVKGESIYDPDGIELRLRAD